MKKLYSILLILSVLLVGGINANAEVYSISSEEINFSSLYNVEDLYYTIEDENGNYVESGYLSPLTRATWSNTTLNSGYTFILYPIGMDGFFVRQNNTMNISYTINKSASTNLKVAIGTKTKITEDYSNSSVSTSYTSLESNYYKIHIKNNSSSTIVLESVTITY